MTDAHAAGLLRELPRIRTEPFTEEERSDLLKRQVRYQMAQREEARAFASCA